MTETPATTPDGIPVHAIPGLGCVILASEHNAKMTEMALENYLLKQKLDPAHINNLSFKRGYLACASKLWAVCTGPNETKDELSEKILKIVMDASDIEEEAVKFAPVVADPNSEIKLMPANVVATADRERREAQEQAERDAARADANAAEIGRLRGVLRIARDGIRQDLERNGSMSDPIRTALVAIEDILSNEAITDPETTNHQNK